MKLNRSWKLAGLAALGLAISIPAAAQTDVLVVNGTSVGVLTSTPATTLEIVEPDDTKAGRVIIRIAGTDFYPQFEYTKADEAAKTWRLGVNPLNEFVINQIEDLGVAELKITPAGSLIVNNNMTMNVPDYVFDEGYELMPLDELRAFIQSEGHLPNVISEADVAREGGVDIATLPLQLLEKIEMLTLYTLDQHDQIEALEVQNQQLLDRLEKLEASKVKKARN